MLNQYFVCVYTANEDYAGPDPPVGAEERAELLRIRNEGYAKNLSVGTVRTYVLTPDGHTYVTVPTHKSDAMLAMLTQAVAQFKPQAGNPVVPPRPQSVPGAVPADAVALHLVSRADERGDWGWIPAENWIVLTREDWLKLTPTGDVTTGQTWELGRDVIVRIFNYFYPQMENNFPTIDRIEQYGLTAKALTVKDGVVTARVDGFVKMKQSFYPANTGRNDPQPQWAAVVGVLTFAPGKPPTLQLATTRAISGTRPFKVTVQSVSQVAR